MPEDIYCWRSSSNLQMGSQVQCSYVIFPTLTRPQWFQTEVRSYQYPITFIHAPPSKSHIRMDMIETTKLTPHHCPVEL